jgi:MFS family permease
MGHMWELYAFWGWVGPFMTAVVVKAGMDAALGGLLAALIIVLGAPSVYLMGIVADRIGRTKTIIIAATCSLVPQFFFGFMLGMPVIVVVGVGIWICFWAIADSAVYKVGLTDMISENIRGTVLGIQSAVGFSMTILAPLAFGKVLNMLNPGVSTTEATQWGPCFLMLGVGALVAPIMAFALRSSRQASLMGGGKL